MAVGMMAVPVMIMRMTMRMAVSVGVAVSMGHGQLSKPGWVSGPETPQFQGMLYYNIARVHGAARRPGLMVSR